MSTVAVGRRKPPPLSPSRRFNADFNAAAVGAPTALEYPGASRRRDREAGTMEATRSAAVEVGRALCRMRTDDAYLDHYGNWTALCNALGIGRQDSYDLMTLGEVTDNLDAAGVNADGLNRRQARVLGRLDPAEQAEVVQQAQADGDTTAAGLDRLRQQLRAPSRPRPRRPGGNPQAIRRTRSGGRSPCCGSMSRSCPGPSSAPPISMHSKQRSSTLPSSGCHPGSAGSPRLPVIVPSGRYTSMGARRCSSRRHEFPVRIPSENTEKAKVPPAESALAT